jgi:solute carrier family 5 (sodium-coupled monocarboxylate transporter), member 8/12
MFVGMIVVIVRGLIDVQGINNLIDINDAGGRLFLFDFNPDPLIRQSFWSLLVGETFYSFTFFCFSQTMLQRFKASKTRKAAQASLLFSVPGILVVLLSCSFMGFILFAFFKDCDPMKANLISNPNQLLSYYVDLRLSMFWGVSGIFMGALFSGALSSVSSNLNSTSTMMWKDLIKRIKYFKKDDPALDLKVNRGLVVFCGGISTGLAFIIIYLGDNLWQINTTLSGSLGAPFLGLYLLASFTSVVDLFGAASGVIIGTIFSLIISFGQYVFVPVYVNTVLPTTAELCLNSTSNSSFFSNWEFNSNLPNFTQPIPRPGRPENLNGAELIFGLGYYLPIILGVIVTFLSGIIMSILNQKFRVKKKYRASKRLVIFDVTAWLVSSEEEVIKSVTENNTEKFETNDF